MEHKKKIFNFTQLKRVFGFALPYKNKLIYSIVLAIVLALMAPIRPLLIQYTINQVIPKGIVYVLVAMTIFQVVILIIETIFRFYFTFLTSWLGQTVVKDMRVKVYNKILHLFPSFKSFYLYFEFIYLYYFNRNCCLINCKFFIFNS